MGLQLETCFGGIARDYLGKVRIKFSRSVDVWDANQANIMAIREDFYLLNKHLRKDNM